jgi:hypothetical protein
MRTCGARGFVDLLEQIDSVDVRTRGGWDKVEQYRQRKQDQLELPPSPLIPAQRPRLTPEDGIKGYLPDLDEHDTDPDSDFPNEPLPGMVPSGLSDREAAILTFEKQGWRHAGSKEQAIRDRFDLSGTRYYQILNALLDNPAALEHDPVLVGRLRRLRSTRSRARGR